MENIANARVTLSRNGCAMATRSLKCKTPCCTVLCRTITVYHRVISLLAPCISGHFLGLRVCISWWENILWYAKEFVKITTELHLRVISLLPRCSSCRLRAPPWWQRVCSVQTSCPPCSFYLFLKMWHSTELARTQHVATRCHYGAVLLTYYLRMNIVRIHDCRTEVTRQR